MAIRVLIEREIEAGQEAKLQKLLMELRTSAMHTRGYISGETLRSLNNPQKIIVISNWNSLEDWKKWEENPDRKKVQADMDELLRSKETATIYSHI
jgi:heme oxygenase (mycobilin-producing)